MKTWMTYFLIAGLGIFCPLSANAAKTPKIQMGKQDFNTVVIGSFEKSDENFIYLQVHGARQLVKVPKRYSLNHPANYSKGLKLRVDLPFSVYIAHNLKQVLKTSKKR